MIPATRRRPGGAGPLRPATECAAVTAPSRWLRSLAAALVGQAEPRGQGHSQLS